MSFRNWPHRYDSSGQALVETILVMPLLIFLILNAVNFGWAFAVALNLSAAPRSGVLYSIMGFETPGALKIPDYGPPGTNTTVSNLAYQDLNGALAGSLTATVQVCSSNVGTTAAGQSKCQTCTCSGANCSTGSCTAGATLASTPVSDFTDPEPTNGFMLDRIDIRYSFSPLIPGRPFGLLLGPLCTGNPATCTFTRHVTMRELN